MPRSSRKLSTLSEQGDHWHCGGQCSRRTAWNPQKAELQRNCAGVTGTKSVLGWTAEDAKKKKRAEKSHLPSCLKYNIYENTIYRDINFKMLWGGCCLICIYGLQQDIPVQIGIPPFGPCWSPVSLKYCCMRWYSDKDCFPGCVWVGISVSAITFFKGK